MITGLSILSFRRTSALVCAVTKRLEDVGCLIKAYRTSGVNDTVAVVRRLGCAVVRRVSSSSCGVVDAQNAYIERFNRTYCKEVFDLYIFDSSAAAREITDRPYDTLFGLPYPVRRSA